MIFFLSGENQSSEKIPGLLTTKPHRCLKAQRINMDLEIVPERILPCRQRKWMRSHRQDALFNRCQNRINSCKERGNSSQPRQGLS